MTIERRNLIAAVILLGADAAIFLLAGIMAGFHEDWGRMTLLLFGSVQMVFFGMICLLGMTLNHHLTWLEDYFKIDRKSIPVRPRRIGTAVGIFMVLSVSVHMVLAIVAGFRGHWFGLGIYLTACAVTLILCVGFMFIVGVHARLARLEQLPAGIRKAENA